MAKMHKFLPYNIISDNKWQNFTKKNKNERYDKWVDSKFLPYIVVYVLVSVTSLCLILPIYLKINMAFGLQTIFLRIHETVWILHPGHTKSCNALNPLSHWTPWQKYKCLYFRQRNVPFIKSVFFLFIS